jgi:hypothetical protein
MVAIGVVPRSSRHSRDSSTNVNYHSNFTGATSRLRGKATGSTRHLDRRPTFGGNSCIPDPTTPFTNV